MASRSFVLPLSETFGQHDQELVDRHQETDQGTSGSLDREIRELIDDPSFFLS